jgi:peptide/nickel transport system substrate-binding protein
MMRVFSTRHNTAPILALALGLLIGGSAFGQSTRPEIDLEREVPFLIDRVREGTLPPVAQRLPTEPRVIDLAAMGRQPGAYGGRLRMLMGDQRDIRFATVYGYARLIGYDQEARLVPDILANVEVENGRTFTLRLRRGHRWSDGQPFTSEDFRYWWEDVANNKRLSRSGLPMSMLTEGKPPRFEVMDEHTVRYSWPHPNPRFLPALAGAQPLIIAMPAHYMKRFHEKYASKKELAELVRQTRVRDWGALHERKARSYRPENPELPTLDPWVNRVAPPAERFVFERNPYFHRVDLRGRQLPYIDRLEISTGTSSLIAAKVASGEADLQARYLRFENYTFLKNHEKQQNYRVLLWDQGSGSQIALKPNLNVNDPILRDLFRDVRFRRALSIGFNRRDINKVIFFGLGREAGNSVLPGSMFYNEADAKAWTQFDPKHANALLDEMGLTRRDASGTRLLADGRTLVLTVETSGESTEEVDVLQLIAEDWAKIGIHAVVRSTQRDVFRRRAIAGQNQISVWQGMDNGTPVADTEPEALAPTNSSQFEWPLWGQYEATSGKQGEQASLPEVRELIRLNRAWAGSATDEERRAAWRDMLRINAEQVYTIGIINQTKLPVVVSSRLRNVPEFGIYSFEPRAFFGAYMPDTFYYAQGEGQ